MVGAGHGGGGGLSEGGCIRGCGSRGDGCIRAGDGSKGSGGEAAAEACPAPPEFPPSFAAHQALVFN